MNQATVEIYLGFYLSKPFWVVEGISLYEREIRAIYHVGIAPIY